jgi:four helix bundle protein
MNEYKHDDFRDLDVWQRCRGIRKDIWDLVKIFPADEKYRLSDQLIRSARSAAACIAEGYGRYHYQENIQFCRQSRGSLNELIDHVLVAEECKYINENQTRVLVDEIKMTIRILNGYIKYLKERKGSG